MPDGPLPLTIIAVLDIGSALALGLGCDYAEPGRGQFHFCYLATSQM